MRRKADFHGQKGAAFEIHPVADPPLIKPAHEKSFLLAGLLALFLGPLGGHKFYMGYKREGKLLVAATFTSCVLSIFGIGIFGLLAVAVVSLAEAIIYLTSGQERFRQVYLEGRKSWF